MTGILCMMAGLGGPKLQLSGVTITSNTTSPVQASASFELTNAGDVNRVTTLGGTVDIGDWIVPKSAAGSGYECRATVTAGALSSGTTGTWLSLGTTRTWTVNENGGSSSSATLTIDIGRAGLSTAIVSATIVLNANQAP